MFSAYEYNSPPELRSFPLVQGVSSIYNLKMYNLQFRESVDEKYP